MSDPQLDDNSDCDFVSYVSFQGNLLFNLNKRNQKITCDFLFFHVYFSRKRRKQFKQFLHIMNTVQFDRYCLKISCSPSLSFAQRLRQTSVCKKTLSKHSDRVFDVIHHWNGWFMNLFCTGWKTKVSPVLSGESWCLDPNISVFFMSLKTPDFEEQDFDTHSFWEVAVQNWEKGNKLSSLSAGQIGQCLSCAISFEIAWEM